LLLLGWSVTRIAKRLHCTDRAIRYAIDKAEFQTLFDTLQQEHFQAVHHQLGNLLTGAVDALEKMLRHKDWQARDADLEHIFRIHGKYFERIDVFDHSRHVQGEPADESMSDEMRQKARELLTMQRQMLQKSLPARFRTYEPDPDRHGHHEERDDATGRYTSSNGHDDEDA
jgi:hypothetical protein